jgi:signal transduction histidine kinase/CheY-like chemotaxis protein
MSYDQALATIGATVGVLVALLTLGLARAPGCRGLQWLGVIAFCAGAICTLRTIAESATDGAVAVLTQVGMALSGVMLLAWVKYEASDTGRTPSRSERVLAAGGISVAVLSLVPSLVVSPAVIRHGDGWSSVVYVDALPTPFGALLLVATLTMAAVLLSRYVRRWRSGDALAGAHALALGGLLAAGAYDTVDGTWTHHGMHMLPLGLLWTIGSVGVALVGRFVQGARKLEDVSIKLEQAMKERTAELATARADLVETRELAILGRLSAAVAHEINNPVAVVAANLGFLKDGGGAFAQGSEELDAIQDTLASVDRIAGIVRQLGEAGELAGHGGTIFPVGLASTVAAAVAAARSRVESPPPVAIAVANSLFVSSQEASLRQVLTALIVTAMETIRGLDTPGQVRVSALRHGDRIELRVDDDAPEQDDVLRERRFKPFFDTRPEIVRNDVGLSVSLALLRMLGGDLALERSDDHGSVVRIDLRAAEAPATVSDAPASVRTPRARLLIVDDDVLTRIGMRRLLGREYVIEEAGSVAQAVDVIRGAQDGFDAIICDLVMPDGGAESLLAVLAREAPRLADALVLVTGGAVDATTSGFLTTHAHRAVRKPVDLATLRVMIERVRVHRLASPQHRSGG